MRFRPLSAWNRFWFAPTSGRPLGAFRVVYGVLAVINLVFLTCDLDYWLTDTGLLKGREPLDIAGPYRFSPLNHWHDPMTVRVVLGLTMAAAVGLTLGWRTRLMSVAYYVGLMAIHHRNLATASGADVLFMCLAFYLMLCPCGAAYSLDALRARRDRGDTPADPLIIPWGQRLIQIQLGVVYTATSLLKVAGPTWLNGTALHYVLCNREVGHYDLSWLAGYPVAVNLLTYGGLFIELCLAFLIWVRAARPWVIPLGLSLHLGIAILINIPLFGELTTACYLVFLGPEEWEWVRTRLNPARAVRRLVPARPSLDRGRVAGPVGFARAARPKRSARSA